MTNNNQTNLTQFMMQFCYTCDDAGFCTTEEHCKECMTSQGMVEREGTDDIRQMLNAYYA